MIRCTSSLEEETGARDNGENALLFRVDRRWRRIRKRMGSITDFLPAQILTVLLRGNLRQQLSVSQYFYRDPPLRMVAVHAHPAIRPSLDTSRNPLRGSFASRDGVMIYSLYAAGRRYAQ